MKYLFIGGPVDGERIELVLDMPYHKIFTKGPWKDGANPEDSIIFEEHVYQLQTIGDEGGKHHFYVHSSLKGQGLCGLLLEKYPEPLETITRPFKDDEFIEVRLVVKADNMHAVVSKTSKSGYPGDKFMAGDLSVQAQFLKAVVMPLTVQMLKELQQHGTQRFEI